jgi:hypothetical protein
MAVAKCDIPVPGGCGKPARSVVLARSGENMIGNGMAVWTAYWRCEEGHAAVDDAARIKQVDEDAQVLVFAAEFPLQQAGYMAIPGEKPVWAR